MVEVQIVDVIMPKDEKQGHHVVILHDKAQQRILPIWIGPFEAHQVALQLLEAVVPRPMTYDFMANLLKATGAVLEEIQISSLQEFTYYATAILRVGGTVQQIDARPSDAMALALRLKSKISVAEDVMAKASMPIPDKFRDRLPLKGLEQLAAKMEESKREHEQTLAKFKEERDKIRKEEESTSRERLFVHIFGE
jgi:bifunctional DNase/RNase